MPVLGYEVGRVRSKLTNATGLQSKGISMNEGV